ncbi:MAG TPA: hypothetical protein DD635_05385 [Flavobacteriales bacterium]|nr:hypothetical protein [Flavobacteriales bacterium]|tara:strand:+ start:2632 stop:3228 length:597 start_codon:yes stop_codon:yes gene_type:complete
MSRKRPIWYEDALMAVRTLRDGGVILHPSDTVWGLAADATSAQGVKHIFEIKQRPFTETLLMLVDSSQVLEQLLPNLPNSAWELLEVTDRPVTLVGTLGNKDQHTFASGIVRENASIAVRLVSDPYLSFLIQGIGAPLASTSANVAGKPTPMTFIDIDKQIKSLVDFKANYRREELNSNQSSLLVQFDDAGCISILRS